MKISRESVDLARANRCMTVTALAEAYGVSFLYNSKCRE